MQNCCSFFRNYECVHFPCHKVESSEDFNCLFCYCPLYALGDQCGGSFTYLPNGIKDCSNCLRPHRRENYGDICEMLNQVMELVKKQPQKAEEP